MILYNCQELSERYCRGELEDASWLTRLLVRMHLAMCRHCRLYREQVDFIVEAVRRRSKGSVEPERLKKFEDRLIRDLTK